MHTQPSLRARLFEWVFWRIDFKHRKFGLEGLRERTLKSRPAKPGLPKSFYRRFHVRESDHKGRPVFTIAPRRAGTKARMLYLHGGGYAYEAEAPQWAILQKLLKEAAFTITVPFYPLAPEHTCVEILGFAEEVYATVQQEAGGSEVILAGDSAGGGLALALAQLLRDKGEMLPVRMVLISPWLDVTCSDPAQVELEKLDPILPLDSTREMGRWYAGDLDPADSRISPLFGSQEGLPTILLLTGTHDLLNSDAHRLKERMAGTNSALIFSEYLGMAHDWVGAPMPEASEAVREIVRFLGLGGG